MCFKIYHKIVSDFGTFQFYEKFEKIENAQTKSEESWEKY